MKKTSFATLGTMLMLTVVLAACGSDAKEKAAVASASTTASGDKPVEIEFWHIISGEIVNQVAEQYNSSQNKVKVKPVFVQGSYEGIVEKLQVQAAAKKMPDVVTNGLLYTRFANDTVRAVPLDSFIQRDGYDTSDFYPSMLKLGKNEQGKQIGFPFGISTPVLYYNADRFREAGLNPDAPPQTWEELSHAAKSLTRDGHYGLSVPIDFGWLYQAMLETFGGSMLSKDGTKVGLDSEASIKAVQTIVDMVQKDKTVPVLQALQSFDSMAKGNVSMLVQTTAGLGIMKPTVKYDLRTAPFPTYQGKRVVPAGGSNLMIFATDTKKQEAAWDFIKYLTAPQNSVQIAKSTGYMVTRKSALESDEMKRYLEENPNYKATYSQINEMVPWFNFPGKGGSRVQKIISDQIQAALQNQKQPEEAMKEAAKQANALINS